MDTAFFFRSKLVFWSWVFLPVLLRVGFLVALYATTRISQESFVREQVLAQSAPILENAIKKNKELIASYSSNNASVQEQFLTEASRILNQTGLQGTVNVKLLKPNGKLQPYMLEVEGTTPDLYYITAFLDAAAQAGYTQVNSASILQSRRRDTVETSFSLEFRTVEFSKDL
jgi:hypothetical protein